ncbi:MAG: DUF1491 family protein [Alphaproteobacteria bacterium]|nr:MAG: DUF1491 family protein [Alphaproteobacteria bacterium]
MTVRLTTRFWVDAYIARARAAHLPVYVAAHGDDTAGAVIVKCCPLDGTARAFHRVLGPEGRRWDLLAAGAEAEVDAAIARQRGFDPDLWVIEIEDRQGRHLLEQEGLAQ